MLVEKPNFVGVINPKAYLNHELGSKFFFLSDLAYKLVNLLVFEKFSCKMSKNWTFWKIIGLGLNFTYEFEVCSSRINKQYWNSGGVQAPLHVFARDYSSLTGLQSWKSRYQSQYYDSNPKSLNTSLDIKT